MKSRIATSILLFFAAVVLTFLPITIVRQGNVDAKGNLDTATAATTHTLLNGSKLVVVNDSSEVKFVWLIVGDRLIEVYN
jgi:hypothetical protein